MNLYDNERQAGWYLTMENDLVCAYHPEVDIPFFIVRVVGFRKGEKMLLEEYAVGGRNCDA